MLRVLKMMWFEDSFFFFCWWNQFWVSQIQKYNVIFIWKKSFFSKNLVWISKNSSHKFHQTDHFAVLIWCKLSKLLLLSLPFQFNLYFTTSSSYGSVTMHLGLSISLHSSPTLLKISAKDHTISGVVKTSVLLSFSDLPWALMNLPERCPHIIFFSWRTFRYFHAYKS